MGWFILARFGGIAMDPNQTADPVHFFRQLLQAEDPHHLEDLLYDIRRQGRSLVAMARQHDLSGILAKLAVALPRSGLLNDGRHDRERALIAESFAAARDAVVIEPDPVARRAHLNGANGQRVQPMTLRPNLGTRLGHKNGEPRR
jgi:hypothetical protein